MVLMKLGYFDPASGNSYRQIPPSAVNSQANQQLALDAARQGIVLLQNNGKLPFSTSTTKTIAVIGPNANNPSVLQGNYYGAAPYLITPLKGIGSYVTTSYAQGCTISGTDTSGISAAVSLAKTSDATVLVVGIDQTQESEGLDRVAISFPGVQEQLISQVASASKGPVILVVMSGSSLDISAQVSNTNISAILWVGYPGQSGGQAIGDILFGAYNPAGRLPFTMHYANFVNEVPLTDMGMRPSSANPGRTYRFYTGKKIFEFGFGLSYTTFTYTYSYSASAISGRVIEKAIEVAAGDQNRLRDPINIADAVSVNVTNTGKVAGSDVVLGFVVPANAGQNGVPLKYLADFTRIYLLPGQSQVVTFNIPAQFLTLVGVDGQRRTVYDTWKFVVGVGKNQISKDIEILPESSIVLDSSL